MQKTAKTRNWKSGMSLVGICLLWLALPAGCVYMQPSHQVEADLQFKYYEQIRDWQERIHIEGWTEALVDDVVYQCRVLSRYTSDETAATDPYPDDHWKTPREMIASGFKGDCEDIAGLMRGTLVDYLNYPPERVRMVIVTTPLLKVLGFPLSMFMDTDHCIIRVQLPDGTWKPYDSVDPILNLGMFHYYPTTEFTEYHVWRR